MAFSADEIERYSRHFLLKEIGGAGQQRLKRSSIACVGVGGVGGPASLYLAAAGVGRLLLIDDDAVSLSNLQRQIQFSTLDIGRPKTDAAQSRLQNVNPHIAVEVETERLTSVNAKAMLSGVDLVLDGSDSFATRYAVNEACHDLGKPLVSGAVGRWTGQVAIFASGVARDGAAPRLPCYRCFVPETPPDAELCAVHGVVGALTGVVGSMAALEAIKLLTGAGEALLGRIFLLDTLSATARTVKILPDPACPVCG